jgi:hypothetical protein
MQHQANKDLCSSNARRLRVPQARPSLQAAGIARRCLAAQHSMRGPSVLQSFHEDSEPGKVAALATALGAQ